MSKYRQFAVLGLGRFGKSVVKVLFDNGYNVLACDSNMSNVKEVSSYSTLAVEVDVTDELAVKQLGLKNYDVVIIAIGEDLEASIMATLLAKEAGGKEVICKAKTMLQKSVLLKVGADRVVLPEKEMGERVATNLITTNVIDFITLSDNFGIAEIEPKSDWIGKNLIESNIRAEYSLNIVAIKRDNDEIMVSPYPTEIITEGDRLVVIGESQKIQMVTLNDN